MKKWLQGFVVLVTAVVLTGCVKADYHLTINKDGSATLANTLGLSNDMYSMVASSGDPFEDSKVELEEEGYKVEKFKDDEYTGITATKTFDSLKNLKLNSGDDEVGEVPFKVEEEKGLFATVYKVKGEIDLTSEETESEEESNTEGDASEETDMGGLNSILEQAEMTFRLSAPGEISNSNATEVDSKTNTATWELNANENNEITFEISVPSKTGVAIAIGGGVIVLGGLALVIVARRRNN